jgi:DNA-binding GntR family transcriptional regulator
VSFQAFDVEPAYQQVWETVCARVREAILTGDLAAGTKLVEADLARTFGVSRGPIREALRELSREGLVVDLPRRGTFVCTLTQTDLIEVYGVREALESVAVREAVQRATDEELAKLADAHALMDDAWRGDDWHAAITADKAFHLTLINLAKNGRMATIYEQMAAQTFLLLVTMAETDVSIRGAPLQAIHRAILDAVVARDLDGARSAIADHYRYTRERLFETIQRGDDGSAAALETS